MLGTEFCISMNYCPVIDAVDCDELSMLCVWNDDLSGRRQRFDQLPRVLDSGEGHRKEAQEGAALQRACARRSRDSR